MASAGRRGPGNRRTPGQSWGPDSRPSLASRRPIIDADGYQQPAARTARQLIEIALLNDRFSPGDLSGVVALADIFLRSAPEASDYRSLLEDLGDECKRWAGPTEPPSYLTSPTYWSVRHAPMRARACVWHWPCWSR